MKLQQLSLFLENRSGALRAPCDALAAAGIDVLTMSLADSTQFGVLRLVVRDPERALQVLEKAGMVAKVTEVVTVQVENKPGGLAAILKAIDEAGLGVEYMYDFGAACKGGQAAIIFRFDDPDTAVKALTAAGVRVLTREEMLGS